MLTLVMKNNLEELNKVAEKTSNWVRTSIGGFLFTLNLANRSFNSLGDDYITEGVIQSNE